MSKPFAVDLFCGAGGSSMGLHRAGFEVMGVDLFPMPNYPFPFVQSDAIEYSLDGRRPDFIWASPPCQAYSWSAKRWTEVERVNLIPATREKLLALGIPFVMENVPGSPLRVDLVLTGPMFNLGVIRRRHFELNWPCPQPAMVKPKGSVRTGEYVTVAGHGGDNIKGRGSRAAKQAAMGIDWMTDSELNEAVPPAYAEYIGRAALDWIGRATNE